MILFTGTSCMIHGIRLLAGKLGVSDENVIWVDFICGGVISPRLWDEEIRYNTNVLNESVKRASFRDKRTGWRKLSVSFFADEKTVSEPFHLSHIGILHRNDMAKMGLCGSCRYRSYKRCSDITLGDFWNEEYLPKMW